MNPRMRLSELLPDVSGIPAALEITGIVQDSRAIVSGNAFVAIAGFGAHGLGFVAQAKAAGAAAVLFEPPMPAEFHESIAKSIATSVDEGAAIIAVPGLRACLGRMADTFHGEPSRTMTTVGVTGTNGKTSTVQLLAQAWTLRGRRAGSIGTLGAGLYGEVVATGFTTPLVLQLHALLAQLRDAGADAVAMEVSSHALDQGRADGVHFKVGMFTNLTRDHLDYHGTMDAYGSAKAKLFAWPGLEMAVLNIDDAFGLELHAAVRAPIRAIGVSSRGASAATVCADDIVLDLAGLSFVLRIDGATHPVRSPLLGRFNVDNLLAVAGALYALGETPAQIASTLSMLQPVNGRMNRLGGDGRLPLVVIDYAHTPDALEQALTSLRAHAAGRLVCVFGCGGDRDRGKRPQMAAIAETQADAVIVTDDNPRTENGDAIVADIAAGFTHPGAIVIQRDRAAAIAAAIHMAAASDVVLVAGKGHEPYQEIDGVQYPFDDTAIARTALEVHV